MTRPRLLVPAALMVGAVLGACGSDTGAIDAGAVPQSSVPVVVSDGVADADGIETTIYFTRGEELVPATRVVPDRGDLTLAAADAIRALLDGPTREEKQAGFGSEIPPDTQLLDVQIGDDRIASVDLSREFETGGGTASVQARLGQVACTVDNVVALDIADGTRFLLDGDPVEVFSGEGIVLDGPVTCADYQVGATSGDPAPACVEGWRAPGAGDPLRGEGLDLLRISVGTAEQFVVEDIRYFTGPDGVERWYVEARMQTAPGFRGRFLIERRGESGGVVAVAPPSTSGWESPDWAGFEGEGELTAYPDLPGQWAGTRFDFVTGTGGPGVPGLPAEVAGCVADT